MGDLLTDSFRTSWLEICFMAFEIKGQTKAVAAFIGILGTYCPILVNFNMQASYQPPPQVTKEAEPLNVVYYNDREFEHE